MDRQGDRVIPLPLVASTLIRRSAAMFEIPSKWLYFATGSSNFLLGDATNIIPP